MPSKIFEKSNNTLKTSLNVILIASSICTFQIFAASIEWDSDSEPPTLFKDQDSSDLDFYPQDNLLDSDEFQFFDDSAHSPRELIHRGLTRFNSGNKEQGIKDLEKAWEMAPDLPITGISLALLHIKNNDFKKALELSNDLKTLLPEKHKAYILEGFAYQGLNDKPRSISAFQKALRLNPGNPTASASLAGFALMDKNEKKAKQLYLNTLKYNPGHIRTILLLSQLLSAKAEGEMIENLLEKAIQTLPDTFETHYTFASVYGQIENISKAIIHAQKALDFKPDNAPTEFLLAQLLASDGQIKLSRSKLRKLAKAYPGNPQPKELEARLALDQNEPKEAVKLFQDALNIKNTISLAIQLANAQLLAGDNVSALETIRSQTEIHPSNILMRSRYAELLRKQGKINEAKQQYKEILSQRPNSVDIQNNLAWLMLQEGKFEEALSQARQAHNLAPRDPNIMDTLANILLKQKQYKEAETLFIKALDIQPSNLSIRYHFSEALVAMNKTEQAKAQLKKLLSSKEVFRERQQAEELLNRLKSH